MRGQSRWFEQARTFLEGVSTTEGRIVVTVGLLAGALLIGRYLLPRFVTAIDRSVRNRFDESWITDVADLLGKYVLTTLGGVLLRTVQLALVLSTGIAMAVLWGRSDLIVMGANRLVDGFPLVRNLVTSIVLLVFLYVGVAALSDSVARFGEETEWMTDHQQEIVLRVSQLGLFVLIGLLLMGVWGVNLGGFLVGAGFLGIVVGFAARQTLGSLIAGFVLMFSRPFTIGDWVEVGDREGIVTDITIFNTRLENFDGEFVVIPNDIVSNRPITNRSQKGLLRLRIDVGVDYDVDPDHAREVAKDAIRDLDVVLDGPPPQVFPKDFGDSAVILEMRFWIDRPTPPRKWRAVSAVITGVKDGFEENGIKIPYPQQELSGRAETGGFQVHQAGVEPTRASDGAVAQPGEDD